MIKLVIPLWKQIQLSDTTLHTDSGEDEVFHQQFPLALSKQIIRPLEETINNKRKIGIGYEKEVIFLILDYSKPILFQSARFLQEGSSNLAPF